MPYRLKLADLDEVSVDDETELGLPSDLALLGQQLQDDAAHLGELYPSDVLDRNWLARDGAVMPVKVCSRDRKRSRATAAIALASILLLAVAVPVSLQSLLEPTDTSVASEDDDPKLPNVALPAPATVTDSVPVDAAVMATSLSADDFYLPVTYVADGPFSPELTGPQQEAQLDIWLQERPEMVLLSL